MEWLGMADKQLAELQAFLHQLDGLKLTLNQRVQGSSPCAPTKQINGLDDQLEPAAAVTAEFMTAPGMNKAGASLGRPVPEGAPAMGR